MQPQPVLAADDRGWEAGSGEPVGTGRWQGQGPQLAGIGEGASRSLPTSQACWGLRPSLEQEGRAVLAQLPPVAGA